MQEHFVLPQVLAKKVAQAGIELEISEQDFVLLAVGEKLARQEHEQWLRQQSHVSESEKHQTANSPRS